MDRGREKIPLPGIDSRQGDIASLKLSKSVDSVLLYYIMKTSRRVSFYL